MVDCLCLQELSGELGQHLKKQQVSVEQSLRIVYMPQAVFRVRPVARCTASMPGACYCLQLVYFATGVSCRRENTVGCLTEAQLPYYVSCE
jgi:hypothetical protein